MIFEGWNHRLFETLLFSMVNLSSEIPEIDGRGIAEKAMFEAGRKGEIKPNQLMAEINILEHNYLDQPIK